MPFALPQNKSSRLMRYLYAIRQAAQIIIRVQRHAAAPRSCCRGLPYPHNATKKRGCAALLSHFIKYCEEIRLLPLPAAAKHNRGWSAPRSGCSGTLPALLSHFIKYCEEIRLLPLPAAAKHNRGWSAPRSRSRSRYAAFSSALPKRKVIILRI